jgi:aryl-alcohol dehydrogenase-like predicted oxidoreductase
MTPESLPSHLHVARTPLRRFRDHARAAGLTPSALALAMVLARPEVTSMVIGAELPIHINDAALAATLTLEETVISEAWQLAANLPRAVVNPSLWPKTD